jgi:hypothetical protein
MTATTTFRKASGIKVPDILFKTIKTRVPEIDNSFSEIEGIVPSQVVLVTGKPGAGKTTLSLLIASKMFMETKKPGAFISLEMSDFQLALSAKKIPGFDTMMVSTEFGVDSTIRELEIMKPSIIVLDSIQKAASLMVKNKEALNFNQAQKDIVSKFYAFAKKTFIPVFLIGHVSKSGTYIGPSHLEHEVDSHLLIDWDKDLNLRTFWFDKNRFGGNNDTNLFGITHEGVWVGSPYLVDRLIDDPESDFVTKVPDNHDKAVEKVSFAFEQFKMRNTDAKTVPAIEVMTLAKEMIEFLKVSDAESIIKNSYIGNVKQVKLTYDYKGVAQCNSRTGNIRIGNVMYTERFRIGSIGYKKEQPFIKRNVKNREELYAWVILHEWVHLYKGMQHHKVSFFQCVESLWKKFKQHTDKKITSDELVNL